MPRYGDKTQKELDNYIKDYKLPVGRVRTGLVAPIKDLSRNYFTMKEKQLDPSDHFFHCKIIMKLLQEELMEKQWLKNLVI